MPDQERVPGVAAPPTFPAGHTPTVPPPGSPIVAHRRPLHGSLRYLASKLDRAGGFDQDVAGVAFTLRMLADELDPPENDGDGS